MELTVKSVQSKTGTSTKGAWELVIISAEDGTDYATFDTKAKSLLSGTVIKIDDVKVKEGKISFKEFVIVSAPAAPLPGLNGADTTTNEQWAEKQRIERISIEGQSAIKQLVIALGTDVFEDQDVTELQSLLKRAFTTKINTFIGGAVAQIQGEKTTKTTPTTKPLAETSAIADFVFANPGEFYTACHQHFNLDKTKVATEIGTFDLAQPAGRLGAWAAILAVYGAKDEKDTAKKENPTKVEDLDWK